MLGRRRQAARRTAGAALREGPLGGAGDLQAMDAAGKDGVIKHVMSGVNPQGCEVHSFKAPSAEELDHDFLWRTTMRCRSAAASASSTAPTTRRCWWCACIRNILARAEAAADARRPRTSGRSASRTSAPSSAIWRATARWCCKFFLHVSQEEQRKRFLERLDEPGEALEVHQRRRRRAQAVGRIHGRLRGRDPPHQPRRRRRGMSCRPTTNGSRGWWWPAAVVEAHGEADLAISARSRHGAPRCRRRARRCCAEDADGRRGKQEKQRG